MKSKKNGTIFKKKQKKGFTNHRQEQGKIGGGQRPKPISQAMESIIDLYKDSASFKGLDGIDTCIQIEQDSDGKITFNVFYFSMEVILNHFHFVFLSCYASRLQCLHVYARKSLK